MRREIYTCRHFRSGRSERQRLYGRFQAAKSLYIREFQKGVLLAASNQNHQDSGCIGVARLERGISTTYTAPAFERYAAANAAKRCPLRARTRPAARFFVSTTKRRACARVNSGLSEKHSYPYPPHRIFGLSAYNSPRMPADAARRDQLVPDRRIRSKGSNRVPVTHVFCLPAAPLSNSTTRAASTSPARPDWMTRSQWGLGRVGGGRVVRVAWGKASAKPGVYRACVRGTVPCNFKFGKSAPQRHESVGRVGGS